MISNERCGTAIVRMKMKRITTEVCLSTVNMSIYRGRLRVRGKGRINVLI